VLNIYVAIRAGSAHDEGDFATPRRAGLVAEFGIRPQIAALKEKRSFPTRSTGDVFACAAETMSRE
jgi:hypothetical protein